MFVNIDVVIFPNFGIFWYFLRFSLLFKGTLTLLYNMIFYTKKELAIYANSFFTFYSLLNANTGSSLAAFLDGIIPPINVKTILNIIKISPASAGSEALTSSPLEIELII